MIQIECPFCEEPLAVEPAAIRAPSAAVHCNGCSVTVEFEAPQVPAMDLAA